MGYRVVKLICPCKASDTAAVDVFMLRVPLLKAGMNIYDVVDFFADEISSRPVGYHKKNFTDIVPLRDLMNLHNDTGIRDISGINSLVEQIIAGEEILAFNGLPNTKLVETRCRNLLLFDGHHSTLAYMLAGRKYLHEIPHLIVEDGKKAYVSDEEIRVFFGAHATELRDRDWKGYVINWQAPGEEQLEERVQRCMGELLDRLLLDNRSLLQRKPCDKIRYR